MYMPTSPPPTKSKWHLSGNRVVLKMAPKGLFFWPKFYLLSEFERIFEKSQIFFIFRDNFRKTGE